MAHIDDLVKLVGDSTLRDNLERAVEKLRKTRQFGLVYEEHIPEVIAVPGLQLEIGGLAQVSGQPGHLYRVVSMSACGAKVLPLVANHLNEPQEVDTSALTPVLRFGEPIYPSLEHVDALQRGSRDTPHHIVIEAENYHALQLLIHLYEKKVDCIYIDPPYNSGATDWKYNNRYIDSKDSYRHSKWLSMMEKRLSLAKRLLKHDATLIVTIDENEVCHLGLLLEQVFKSERIQLVTIVSNTAGASSPGQFSRADEYAFFCRFGSAKPAPMAGDLLSESASAPQLWFPFHRARGINDRPSKRPNLVYPIIIGLQTLKVEHIGPSLHDRMGAGEQFGDLDEWLPNETERSDGCVSVWPILNSGELSVWQANAATLGTLISEGFFRVRRPRTEGTRPLTVSYVKKGNRSKVLDGTFKTEGFEGSGARIIQSKRQDTIAKTVWKVRTHDARIYGTTMLRSLIGQNDFSYPKSPYAVLDTLKATVGDMDDAVILDFFGGSGTTLHSTLLLNELDGGTRQCILVTNNEIGPKKEKELLQQGVIPQTQEWRRHGIFEAVTLPRVRAAIRGRDETGRLLDGDYIEPVGKSRSSGFHANVDFLRLQYLEPESLVAERCFDAFHPLLWAASGFMGACPTIPVAEKLQEHEPGYLLPDGTVIPSDCRYAVLLRESRFSDFSAKLFMFEQLTHLWLQARSESSFAIMREMLPPKVRVRWLFRDMLRHYDRGDQGSTR